jgi:hypothetical protein
MVEFIAAMPDGLRNCSADAPPVVFEGKAEFGVKPIR